MFLYAPLSHFNSPLCLYPSLAIPLEHKLIPPAAINEAQAYEQSLSGEEGCHQGHSFGKCDQATRHASSGGSVEEESNVSELNLLKMN